MTKVVALPKKRAYSNALRRKQAEATRELILDGLEALLANPDVRDFTMADVAKASGVASATLFRQFAGRQALFDALAERAEGRFRLPAVHEIELDSIIDVVPRLHAFYDANATLLRAVRRAPALNRLLEDQRQRRTERITGAVAARYPRWTQAECASSAAAIQLVMSPATWQWLQASKTTAPRTSEIVVDMLRALITRMEQEGPIGGQEEKK